MHEFDAEAEAMFDQVVAYARDRMAADPPSLGGSRSRDELHDSVGETITGDGLGAARAMEIYTDLLAPADLALDHPMALAYVATAPSVATRVFDLAVVSAAIFGGTWQAAAGAVFAENQALRWLADLAGLPAEAGGTFVSGGTAANLSALVAARHAARARGPVPGSGRVAASREAHSSIPAALQVMDAELVEVAVDGRGALTGADLERALDQAGDGVFAVVVSAGTTNAGVIDDLRGAAAVCAERGIWLHVDAAYGGAALASPRLRPAFAGIEAADSLVIDPHKWLFAPYDCAALVYRDPSLAAAAHSQHADYLESVRRQEWNPNAYAFQLTRRARGLPFWFALTTHGTRAYAEAIEAGADLARDVARVIDAHPDLELIMEPDLSVLLFRRHGWGLDEYTAWCQHHAEDGRAFVVPTRWDGDPALRFCFVNPRTQRDDVVALVNTLV